MATWLGKMRKRHLTFWLLFCFIFGLLLMEIPVTIQAKEPETTQEIINDWIKKLKSDDYDVRYEAIINLSNLENELKDEKVKNALLELAKREDDEFSECGKKGRPKCKEFYSIARGQAYSDYRSVLLEALASLKDPRTIPYLADELGSRKVAREGLLVLGEIAAKALLEEVEKINPKIYDEYRKEGIEGKFSSNELIRMANKRPSYLGLFAEMVRPKEDGYMAEGELRERIKKIALESCQSDLGVHRQRGVWVLGNLGDSDVLPLLEDLATNDPYIARWNNKYIVRDAAREALAKFPEIQRQRLEIERKRQAGLLPSSITSAVTYPIAMTPVAKVAGETGKIAEKKEETGKYTRLFESIGSKKYAFIAVLFVVLIVLYFTFQIRRRSK